MLSSPANVMALSRKVRWNLGGAPGNMALAHHITLNKFETILGRLKIKLKDVFPQEYQ
jgi:hypothetical protein